MARVYRASVDTIHNRIRSALRLPMRGLSFAVVLAVIACLLVSLCSPVCGEEAAAGPSGFEASAGDASSGVAATASGCTNPFSPPPLRTSAHSAEAGELSCPSAGHHLQQAELAGWSAVGSWHQRNTPFLNAFGCVTLLTAGHWHYELCPGRWVRQFAIAHGYITAEHILGRQRHWADKRYAPLSQLLYTVGGPQTVLQRLHARSDLPGGDALAELMGGAGTQNVQSYNCSVDEHTGHIVVSGEYIGGSLCAATGAYRSAEVHLICNAADTMPQMSIVETEPCRYTVRLMFSHICLLMQHPGGEDGEPPVRVATGPDGRQVWRQREDSDMRLAL